MKSSSILLLSTLFFILPVSLEARSWKEAGSDRTVVGDFVKTEGDQVVIVRSSGSTLKIPLSKLSEDDQKFVADQAAAKAKADADAAAAKTNVFKWETDLEVAKQRAKDENKTILMDFTGSDWCGWCIKLKDEVFDKPEFQEYAKKHLVMLELDYPRGKKLPSKEKEQNAKLKDEYKIKGYPTIILVSASGKEKARTGYVEGGPAKYVDHLKELLK